MASSQTWKTSERDPQPLQIPRRLPRPSHYFHQHHPRPLLGCQYEPVDNFGARSVVSTDKSHSMSLPHDNFAMSSTFALNLSHTDRGVARLSNQGYSDKGAPCLARYFGTFFSTALFPFSGRVRVRGLGGGGLLPPYLDLPPTHNLLLFLRA